MGEAERHKSASSDRKIEPPAPTRYSWYTGKLIASTDLLTTSDRMELLETHPLFAGRRPECNRDAEESQ